MSSLWIVVIGVVVIYLAYTLYARRIDRTIIQADANRATPARMYMDGADFMPTSRFVLYGYHFKSIAAAGTTGCPVRDRRACDHGRGRRLADLPASGEHHRRHGPDSRAHRGSDGPGAGRG